ncbi:MAG TPA: carboxypeptidase regulatory-like domain-containing protein [Acidobacteriaceae bacterium]
MPFLCFLRGHRSSFASFGACLLTFAMALGFTSICLGQAQNTGNIAGNVTDTQHYVVPSASVTLTSQERGNVYRTTSNGQGEFTFTSIPVGAYTLQVTAPGFSPFAANHINIDADSHFRVDATLQIGSVEGPQVVVNADAVSVDTQGATIQTVIDNDLVENLPIDGNNVVSMAALLPGVTDVSAPTTFTDENGGSSYNANGARNNSNLFLFDGLLWNNLYLNTGINYPNHAVLQQVSVQLNNFSAQYGRNAGSIYNVVSKSGTNQTHGELFFHFHDSSLLDARDYFTHKNNPQYTYQFGGAVGGAIKRDKLFYELEYQSLIGYSAITANAETLSMAEEGMNPDGTPYKCTNPKLVGQNCASFAGDATNSSLINSLIVNPLFEAPANSSFGTNPSTANSQINSTWIAQGNTGISPCITQLTNLGTGYLTNAEVPYICLDPTVMAIIKAGYIPSPDTKLGSSQYLYSSAPASKPQREYGGFARIDYNLSQRQNMAFRFYRTDNTDHAANGGANVNYGVPTYGVDDNAAFITAGSVTHVFIFSPNVVNSATLGYKRYVYSVVPVDRHTLQSFGSTFTYPGIQSMPNLVINTRFNLGNSLDANTFSVNENVEFVDNVNYTRGRHSLQFGMDWLRSQYLNNRTNVGTFNFYGNPGYTNSQGADFMMGLLYSESVGNGQTIAAIQHALYLYVQDQWRLTSKLTLNLGVRYELPWAWYQPNGHAATFVRGYQSTVFKGAPAGLAFVGDPGVPRSLINTDYTNVSPRIGIAYDVFGNGKTAIRAGGGTFYDAIPATIVGMTEPFTYNANYQYPAGSLTNPLYGMPAIPADFTPETAAFTTPYSVIYPDKNYKNAYAIGVNFGIQQQVSKGSIMEVNYLGRFGRHLMMPTDQNETIYDCTGPYSRASYSTYCVSSPTTNYSGRVRYPGFNYGGQGVVDLLPEATGNYNALQVVYRQRATRNLTILANYTYSRTLDEQSNLSTSNSNPTPSKLAGQYGPSSQNTTHIFNAGWRLRLPNLRSGPSPVRAIINNWAFNGTYNARSGHPVNITFGGDELGNDEPSQRASVIAGMNPNLPSNRHRTQKIVSWFNPLAYKKPDAFTPSNTGRNSMGGPAYICTTFSLNKSIQLKNIRKGMSAQFRVEAFNVFNTVNLGQPRANYSASAAQASTFGSINSSGSNPNRRIQFGVIVYF